jgi:hypothetical protein
MTRRTHRLITFCRLREHGSRKPTLHLSVFMRVHGLFGLIWQFMEDIYTFGKRSPPLFCKRCKSAFFRQNFVIPKQWNYDMRYKVCLRLNI